MFADNTLTPREAIRLCALGTLASGAIHYDDLAAAIRHFVSRVAGPSVELMGESIELLRYEGYVEQTDAAETARGPEVRITPAGEKALRTLLCANLRSSGSDLNELIIALKFRFLHLLPPADRQNQVDIFVEASETELARLEDLRRHHTSDPGYLLRWLDHGIQRLEARLDWLNEFRTFATECDDS